MIKIPHTDIYLPIRELREAVISLGEETEDLWLTDRFMQTVRSLSIITKTEGRQYLLWNDAQCEIWEVIVDCRTKKIPTRLIILKYRRKGVSTFFQSIFFVDTLLRANRFSYMSSFEDESTQKIFGMSHVFWAHLREDLKAGLTLKVQRKLELAFAPPHNSHFLAATANRQYLASSQLIHNLHLSEPAKFKDPPAHDAITSILQCVPRHWDTLIAWESTAAGIGIFKDWWDDANSRDPRVWNGYIPIFKTWRGDAECSIQVPAGIGDIFSADERKFQQDAELTDDELYWAKLVRREQCHNDWGEFHQEYPYCARVAFRFGGAHWFDNEGLDRQERLIMDPIARGDLVWDDPTFPVVRWVDSPFGSIEVFEWPDKNANYVIAGDIAEGCEGNFTVFHVWKVPAGIDEVMEQVAIFRSNKTDAAEAGELAYKLGVWYGWAYIGPEVNNQGLLTCTVLKDGIRCPQMSGGYPSLHYHLIPGRKDEPETRKIGWLTNLQNKHLMLGDIKQLVHEGSLIVRSGWTFREMEGFCFDETKKDWVQMYRNPATGLRHTDEVITLAIAPQLIKHRRTADSVGLRMEE